MNEQSFIQALRVATNNPATLFGVLEAQIDAFETSLPIDVVRRVRAGVAAARTSPDDAVRAAFGTGTIMTFDRATACAAEVAGELRRALTEPAAERPTLDPELTAREIEVLRELADGGTNKDVAAALGIRPKTVMHHAASIYRKLHVRGRGEAVAWWFRQRA